MLLHGEACPMTASKPEQPTRKAFETCGLAEGWKRSRSLARLESIGSFCPRRCARTFAQTQCSTGDAGIWERFYLQL